MTRAFVAVPLPDAVLDALANQLSDVPVPGRVTTRDQWHLTLQFLGNDADIDAVVAVLDGIAGPPAAAQVGGAGAFPDAERARVLWLGMAQGVDLLTRLSDEIAERCAPLGHEREVRPFRPHLTLARCRAPTDVRAVIGALGNRPVGPAWNVDAVTVFESCLRPGGAEYVARATVPLRAGSLPA